MTVYSRTGTSCVDFKLADVPAGAYALQVRIRPTARDIRNGEWGIAFVVG